ncbi:hypothetical protein [Halobaculum gomorrense]|uniref:Uncharacterized protein n=1 Tax=Halobaculum gomorrense TaxID=43928 RepID=A0A1M5QNC7_9EURY|nr:hypothetical protein [Halobaculum gomorrense]SHH15260.1 hypothetical protein SAMN05443636_1969 [Halobaculum gomorrense]
MPSENELRVALVGRDPRRTLSVFAAALALALLGYLSAAGANWLPVLFDDLASLVIGVVLVVGGLAAANARWNDGVAGSWALVFGLVVGRVWADFVRRPVFSPDVLAVPLGFAALAAFVVGTVGYVLGRTLESGPRGVAWLVDSDGRREFLVGTAETTFRWLAVAGGLLLGAAGVVGSVPESTPVTATVSVPELFYPLAPIDGDPVVGVVVVLAWTGLAAAPALRGGGLLLSWAVVFAPLFGGTGLDYLRDGISGGGPAVDLALAFIAASAFAVVLGTVGFTVGRSLRAVRRSRSVTPRPS